MSGLRPALAAAALAAALVGVYVALGGGGYEPREVADPCESRPLRQPADLDTAVERLVLSALDGAACRLRVTREELALAIASSTARERFLERHRIREPVLEDAVRRGLLRAIGDARRVRMLSGLEASLLRELVERLPFGELLDVLRGGRDLLELLGRLAAEADRHGGALSPS